MPAPLIGAAAAVAARAIAKKLAQNAAKKSVKKITTGKTKAINKANYKIDGTRRTQGSGAVEVTKSGKLKEFMSGAPVKGATRNVRDTAQRAEAQAKGYTKRQSVLKYPSKKLIRDIKNQVTPKKPIPVKKSSAKKTTKNK